MLWTCCILRMDIENKYIAITQTIQYKLNGVVGVVYEVKTKTNITWGNIIMIHDDLARVTESRGNKKAGFTGNGAISTPTILKGRREESNGTQAFTII